MNVRIYLVPTLRVGMQRGRFASRLGSEPRYFNHPLRPRVVSCTGTPPMQRIVNIASPYRIVMNIFNLLNHHLLILNHLRMTALLPDLIISVAPMLQFVIIQLSEDVFRFFFSQEVYDFSGRERFENADLLSQTLRGGDNVKMIFHDNIGMNFQPVVVLQIRQRIKENFYYCSASEQRQPTDRGATYKMRMPAFDEFVAASVHGDSPLFCQFVTGREASPLHSRAKRGNEENEEICQVRMACLRSVCHGTRSVPSAFPARSVGTRKTRRYARFAWRVSGQFVRGREASLCVPARRGNEENEEICQVRMACLRSVCHGTRSVPSAFPREAWERGKRGDMPGSHGMSQVSLSRDAKRPPAFRAKRGNEENEEICQVRMACLRSVCHGTRSVPSAFPREAWERGNEELMYKWGGVQE